MLRQERTAAMPLRAFVHEAEFEPELLASMGIAFAGACEVLGLADKTDQVTALVASRIIALARCGERDSERLKAAALAAFQA
jgi:hypothetical protein